VQVGGDIDGENPTDRMGIGNGISLSSDGTIFAAGSYLNDGNGNESGHARVFENLNGVWTQIGNDIDGEAALDGFGSSVSISSDGSIVAIGAWLNNGNDSGHVRVFENTTILSTQNNTLTNLILTIKNGKVIANLEGISLTVYNLLGQRILNQYLQKSTIYIVKNHNQIGEVNVRKIMY